MDINHATATSMFSPFVSNAKHLTTNTGLAIKNGDLKNHLLTKIGEYIQNSLVITFVPNIHRYI